MAEPAYPEALPALTHLHWYVLERVLGQGGFGITYLAKDTNLDQRVAVKEYLPVEFSTRFPDAMVRARTEELRERYRWGLDRFIQEARTLARFDHPNIVRVHSVFEANNTAYIVMRFEEGGTLAAMLDRRGTLSEAELLRILLPVLDGLDLVHNAGFIHRDIKPDNIHLGGDGRPVLLDFGSARQAVGSSNTLTILIAPGYAPFEQYYNDPSAQGPWTDIYGLGATAYRAICGRAPLDAVSRSKGILGSTQEIMVPASVVGAGRYSGRFLAAIDHALAFSEKERPQTIAEWRLELAGEGAAPIARPAAPAAARAFGPASAAQPTVLAGAAPVATSAPGPSPVGTKPPVRETAEAAPRSAPPWVWALMTLMVAIAAVASWFAVAGRSDEKRLATMEKQLRENAEAAKQKAQEAEPPRKAPAPEEKSLPAPDTSPPKAPPPPSAKKAPVPAPAPAPKKEPAPTAKEKEAPPLPSPPSVEAPKPPEPKAPAPRTYPEVMTDGDKAWSEQRYAEATKIWEPLASAGNARAQARMGDAFSEGKGVERDAAKARTWYEKAASGGDTVAMVKLGAMFETRNDPTGNYFAYVWYCAAARLGSPDGKPGCERMKPLLQPAERNQAEGTIDGKVGETMRKRKEQ